MLGQLVTSPQPGGLGNECGAGAGGETTLNPIDSNAIQFSVRRPGPHSLPSPQSLTQGGEKTTPCLGGAEGWNHTHAHTLLTSTPNPMPWQLI